LDCQARSTELPWTGVQINRWPDFCKKVRRSPKVLFDEVCEQYETEKRNVERTSTAPLWRYMQMQRWHTTFKGARANRTMMASRTACAQVSVPKFLCSSFCAQAFSPKDLHPRLPSAGLPRSQQSYAVSSTSVGLLVLAN